MMLKEMVWNWRKLNVIGGTAFASEGAADEILIVVGVQLIW